MSAAVFPVCFVCLNKEMLNLVCTFSHPEYVRRGIPMDIFADGAEKDAEDRVADDKSYGRAGGYFTYIS